MKSQIPNSDAGKNEKGIKLETGAVGKEGKYSVCADTQKPNNDRANGDDTKNRAPSTILVVWMVILIAVVADVHLNIVECPAYEQNSKNRLVKLR